jgi:hypothetical protein
MLYSRSFQATALMVTLLLVSCLLISCSGPPGPLEKEVRTQTLDFSPYSEQGFLITPSEYGGEFEAVGFMEVELEPSARTIKTDEQGNPQDLRPGELHVETRKHSDIAYEPPSLREAVDSMHMRARRMGADAIINFSRETYPVSYWVSELPAVRVSGFAINRSKN